MYKVAEINIGTPSVRTPKDIGNNNGGWLCTSIVIPEYHNVLSENSVSYWFYLRKYGVEGKLAKNDPAAKGLKQLMDERAPEGEIEAYLLALCIPRLTVSQFIIILGEVRYEAAKEGRNFVREELSKLLIPE